jgi:Putative secretion activating protein
MIRYEDIPPAPRQMIRGMIERWEGGFQAHPNDVGNYVNGRLIGTNMGVTPAALAAYRGVPATTITQAEMRAMSIEEAVAIGYQNYFVAPGFDRLPYSKLVEHYFDFGWGSGPVTAIRYLQRQVGADVDGVMGPQTIERYVAYVSNKAHRAALVEAVETRLAFFRRICDQRPANRVFLNGWLRRGRWFLPGADESLAQDPVAPARPMIADGADAPTRPPKHRDAEVVGGGLAAGAGAAVAIAQQAIAGAAEQTRLLGLNWPWLTTILGILVVAGAGLAIWSRLRRRRGGPT